MTHAPYTQLIHVKRWADLGLYDAIRNNLERLTSEDSCVMLRILDHIHAVDLIFKHHLCGLPHTFKAARSETMPTLETLAASTREVDDWYADYVAGLGERDFDEPIDFAFTSGKPARMKRGEILLHVCMHGTYHRGNAGALLQLRGLSPSRDSVTDFLEQLSGEERLSSDGRSVRDWRAADSGIA